MSDKPEKAKVEADYVKNEYDVEVYLNGEMPALDKVIKETELNKNISQPPESFYKVAQWAESDSINIKNFLDLNGYFDSRVSYEIYDETYPYLVSLRIFLGDRFKISEISLAEQGIKGGVDLNLPIKVGDYFNYNSYLSTVPLLSEYLKNNGYAYASVVPQPPIVDFLENKVGLEFETKLGHKVRFGDTEIKGLTNLYPDLVGSFILYKKGDIYNLKDIQLTRAELMKTGLFESITILPKEGGKENTETPIIMNVVEEKNKTLEGTVAIRYGDEKVEFAADIEWHHRNLFGYGEALALTANLSSSHSYGGANFEIPLYHTFLNNISLGLELEREKSIAYEKKGGSTFFGVNKMWDHIEADAGISYESFTTTTSVYTLQNDFQIYSFPLNVDFHTETLNEMKKRQSNVFLPYFKSNIAIVPHFGKISSKNYLFRADVSAEGALPLIEDRFQLLSKVKFGVVPNFSRDELPPPKRFYMGGADSIRAYPFRHTGELRGDTPLGGASVAEISVEAQLKILSVFGLNTFVDVGTLSTTANPFKNIKKADDLWWGAGVGLSYYSDFGPLRLDVAFPLNYKYPDDGKKWYQKLQIRIGFGNR